MCRDRDRLFTRQHVRRPQTHNFKLMVRFHCLSTSPSSLSPRLFIFILNRIIQMFWSVCLFLRLSNTSLALPLSLFPIMSGSLYVSSSFFAEAPSTPDPTVTNREASRAHPLTLPAFPCDRAGIKSHTRPTGRGTSAALIGRALSDTLSDGQRKEDRDFVKRPSSSALPQPGRRRIDQEAAEAGAVSNAHAPLVARINFVSLVITQIKRLSPTFRRSGYLMDPPLSAFSPPPPSADNRSPTQLLGSLRKT